MELIFLYIWLKLDVITRLLLVLAGVCGAMAIVSAVAIESISVYASDGERTEHNATWQRRRNRFFVAAIPLFIISALVPSKTDVAVLVGASMAIKFANSPEGEKVSTLLRGKANEILDEELKKLNPVK